MVPELAFYVGQIKKAEAKSPSCAALASIQEEVQQLDCYHQKACVHNYSSTHWHEKSASLANTELTPGNGSLGHLNKLRWPHHFFQGLPAKHRGGAGHRHPSASDEHFPFPALSFMSSWMPSVRSDEHITALKILTALRCTKIIFINFWNYMSFCVSDIPFVLVAATTSLQLIKYLWKYSIG